MNPGIHFGPVTHVTLYVTLHVTQAKWVMDVVPVAKTRGIGRTQRAESIPKLSVLNDSSKWYSDPPRKCFQKKAALGRPAGRPDTHFKVL